VLQSEVLVSCAASFLPYRSERTTWRIFYELECFVLVNDLDAMLVLLSSRPVADCRKVAVHRGGSGLSNAMAMLKGRKKRDR
jgi:hypothetical protein